LKKVEIIAVSIVLVGVIAFCCILAKYQKNNGTFYTLQQAYEQGIINREDLQQIADYQNRIKLNEDTLSKRVKSEIKRKWVKLLNKKEKKIYWVTNAKVKYYGKYKNAYVVMMTYDTGKGLLDWYLPMEKEIEGIKFLFFQPSLKEEILVYVRNA